MIKLDDIAKGDRWPYPHFRIWEETFVNDDFVRNEMDLANDFTDLFFMARLSTNKKDLDDHAEDDINGDLSLDGGGVCHYEWDVDPETNITGKYIGRLYGVRTDGKPWHSKYWYYFYITHQNRPGETSG